MFIGTQQQKIAAINPAIRTFDERPAACVSACGPRAASAVAGNGRGGA
jgi:hypothetical protein